MRNATELLVQYARYHRDRRNIGTHMLGIPLIVFAVGVLLGRVAFDIGGVGLTLAWVAFAGAAIWYLSRHLVLGAATSLAVGLLVGPMFVVAELLFSLGWNRRLFDQITDIAGPTHIRDLAHPA